MNFKKLKIKNYFSLILWFIRKGHIMVIIYDRENLGEVQKLLETKLTEVKGMQLFEAEKR